jgi:hypothetical protein
MLRFPQFFISLPLPALPLSGFAPAAQAEAVMSQLDALRLLAKGRAADERHCDYLSRRDARAFWRAIIREHKSALSAHGRPAVARMLRRARAEAEEVGCNAVGRRLVRSAYTKLARN